MYGDDNGQVRGLLRTKCNKLIKAIEGAVQEMDRNGYSPKVRSRLIKALQDARFKGKN